MTHHMFVQIAELGKRLFTYAALIWLLTGMNHHVSGQGAGFSERPFTYTALMRLLTSVGQ